MQTQPRLLHDWTRQVETLLVGIRITQVRPLALFTLGVVWAGQVGVLAVAQALPLSCHLLSTERRLRRWLASAQAPVGVLWAPLLRGLLPRIAGPELVVVFDPTPYRDRATLLVLSVLTHTRALPVSWRVMPQQQPWPQALAPSLTAMIGEVTAALPPDTAVTLLADRGLVGPTLIDVCHAAGWHLVLRLRGGAGDATRLRLPDGRVVPLPALLTGSGQRLVLPISLFKAAGWRSGWLTVHWAAGQAEPWVLFSDRPGGRDRVREYRTRMRVEATYQDWKRRGFGLERSRISDLGRLDRLVLVLALATWWLHGLGRHVLRSGQRRLHDRPDRRDRSLLQLGRAWLTARPATSRAAALPFRCTTTTCTYRWLL